MKSKLISRGNKSNILLLVTGIYDKYILYSHSEKQYGPRYKQHQCSYDFALVYESWPWTFRIGKNEKPIKK